MLSCFVQHTTYIAGGASDYHKRASYISDKESHVFHPLMKRCLEEKPSARGTFEDALEDILNYLKKYTKNKQAETLEGNKVYISLPFFTYLLYICCN